MNQRAKTNIILVYVILLIAFLFLVMISFDNKALGSIGIILTTVIALTVRKHHIQMIEKENSNAETGDSVL